MATGYQPPWALLNRFTFRTETGTKPKCPELPSLQGTAGAGVRRVKTCDGIIPKSLEPPQPLLDKSPACPCGSSPTASGFLVEGHRVIQGASFSPGTAAACGNLLCSVLKYPGCIPACHSRALLLSSRTPQPALLTAIPGACRSPELLMSSLILHPPTAQSVTAQRSQREAVTPQPRQRGEN